MTAHPYETWILRREGRVVDALLIYRPCTHGTRFYIMQYMKQLLIELEDDVAEKLERVAPGRARRRSEFIRKAIRRALWELEEEATAEAYRTHPDSAADAYIDPRVWEQPRSRKRPRR